ncbi:hypothetical protein GCM10009535_06050 [Streptomyces thermocarboxydovorans]|uniref:Transposase n=1 Tax=Streptomyces thermocarboxydovorans TaxID=59298 RepID=A0ABP3SFS2_9ACTN
MSADPVIVTRLLAQIAMNFRMRDCPIHGFMSSRKWDHVAQDVMPFPVGGVRRPMDRARRHVQGSGGTGCIPPLWDARPLRQAITFLGMVWAAAHMRASSDSG